MWQTVDRVFLGIRAVIDLGKVIYEVSLPTVVILESGFHHLNRDEVLLQILPDTRGKRHSCLSLLPAS